MQLLKNNRDLLKWLKYVPIISIIQLLSFNLYAQNKHTLPEGIKIVDLPDSFFAFKNLESSLIVKKTGRDPSKSLNNVFQLNNSQKKLLWSFIVFDSRYQTSDSEYLANNSSCYIIAKQTKIRNLTPIIIQATSWLYDELIYVLLNTDDKPVARYSLWGGPCGGAYLQTDSTWTDCPYKVSYINGNKISSYILYITQKSKGIGDWDYHPNTPCTIDSITYKAIIIPSGKIQTERQDSIRYTRYVNPKEFH
jgi:hypothetical protein